MSFNQPDVSESARFLNKKDLVLQSQTFSPTASSYFNIGCGYATGYGYLKDHKQAADWFRKAAELGHSLAEYNLGVMHQYGYGVSSDLCQAKSWFRRALSHGLELEQSRLLELFEKYSDLVDIGLASDNSRTVPPSA